MPAVTSNSVEDQNEADQKMWNALKRYIIRERQRKKEGNSIVFLKTCTEFFPLSYNGHTYTT